MAADSGAGTAETLTIGACPACKGRGVFVAGGHPCITCNGTGKAGRCGLCERVVRGSDQHECLFMVALGPVTEAGFRRMCQLHDVTFQYSEDARVWREGARALDAMKRYASQLPLARVLAIWTEVVTEKVGADAAASFRWPGSPAGAAHG